MSGKGGDVPTRIRLDDARRERIVHELRALVRDEFDEDLSDFRAERLLAFFVAALGPAVYNQAITDARAFLAERLDDLDAEFFEPDRATEDDRPAG